MKAALTLLLAATANAVLVKNCQIPTPYVASDTTCTGPGTGYLVYGVCIPMLPTLTFAPYAFTGTSQVRTLLATTNVNAFTAAGRGTAPGCSVPAMLNSAMAGWNAATVTTSTVAPLNTVVGDTKCGGAVIGPVTAANAQGLGADVRCDTAQGYWPTNGFEGTALCGDGTAAGGFLYYPAPTANQNDFWFSGGVSAINYAATDINVDAETTQFTGTNRLLCSRGCVLPASICSTANGLHANIVGSGFGFATATCMVAPARTGRVVDTTFSFMCVSGLKMGQVYTATCTTPNTVAATTYNAQCGSIDGASSTPLWNNNGNLNTWNAAPINQAANSIFGFSAVTSTLSQAYTTTGLGAFNSVRDWNGNGVQALRPGFVYQIVVNGCTGTDRTLCVQRTLNWWRCYYGFPFENAVCYAGNVSIACPVPELGFACPSSSKKGLLGLLGLLGLIPLLLLCCCLLFLCCIRRRKTEADVHFATFDPHAAPMVGTAHCVNPMMTAPCAGSFAPATMPVM